MTELEWTTMEVHGKEPVCEAGGRPNRGGKAAHLSSYARACRADQVPRNPPYTALSPATRSHPRFRRPRVWLRVSGSGGHTAAKATRRMDGALQH